MLSLLALGRGRVVSVRTLADAIWGERQPLSARPQIALCVRALRAAFRGAGHVEPLIVGAGSGYRLCVEQVGVDVFEFDALVDAAACSAAAGSCGAEEAGELYRLALGLWRGPALDGVGGRVTEGEAARLHARRAAAARALLDVGEALLADGFFDEAEGAFADALSAGEALDDLLLVGEGALALGRLCRMLRRNAGAGQYLATARLAFLRVGDACGVGRVSAEIVALAECVAEAPGAVDLVPRQGRRA
ncbi:AfsR/SARP family transcriptional regulator [Streptomyces luteoverticillatus]|uniref:AfsR/SARP family transcriptional regulator n=1 Tax=Streptomyces luteoverticillatus TaxID=66425 RepID=UPI0013DED41C|nr:helix-turn-helix domain-containing protein [Streptomyces luteoverticillatus]